MRCRYLAARSRSDAELPAAKSLDVIGTAMFECREHPRLAVSDLPDAAPDVSARSAWLYNWKFR
jgi:hypothetical protein